MGQGCPKCDGQQPDATAWNYGISLQEASSLDIYFSMSLNRFVNLFYVCLCISIQRDMNLGTRMPGMAPWGRETSFSVLLEYFL